MRQVPPFAFCLLPFALRHRRQRGQALLIAVLVLFAVATLAALFAAVIGAQLAQVTRQSDVVALRNIAEAGLRLANEELTYSPFGADWRPSADPYYCGNGQITIEVSYGPSPDRLQSRFLRILSTAIFPDNPFLRDTILAFKPVLLTDYARFITDRFEANRPAGLGVTGVELGGAARPDYVSLIQGPIRSNTDLMWYGRSYLDLRTTYDSAPVWRDLGILRDDRIEVAGEMRRATPSGTDDALQLAIDGDVGNLGSPSLFAPATPREQESYANGFPRVVNSAVVPNTTTILADMPEIVNASGETLYAKFNVPRVRPPEIDAVHPDKETNRYLELTRDSGFWKQDADTGIYYNTGDSGWGWANYGGIYVDNGPYVDQDGNPHLGDIQYNHDLEKLRLNWTRSVGAHQTTGDQRVAPQSDADVPPRGPADWWDRTGRYYAPPGVEVILHGEAACPYIEIIRHDLRGRAGETYYWRDQTGQAVASEFEPDRAGVIYWQYVPGETMCNPAAANQPFGIYDGNQARFPFPPNGVIYAEGNIRLRGIMPPARDNAGRMGTDIGADNVHPGYFGDYGASGRSRRFDLQVVSGGTIYVEGDVLSPSTARLGGLLPLDPAVTTTYTNDELYGSRVALLARDHVCLNTTALNPRPQDTLRPHLVTAADGTTSYAYYDDAQPPYSSSGNEGYLLFEGDTDPDHNTDTYGAGWTPTPEGLPTVPDSIRFIYTNSRLQVPDLTAELADLRLIVGHSALYVPEADLTPPQPGLIGVPYSADQGQPPSDTAGPGQDQPSVSLTAYVNDPARATPWPWGFGGTRYSFLRQGEADPTTRDESAHWYNDPDPVTHDWAADDWIELLPSTYQAMLLQAGGEALTGYAIDLVPRVSPVRRWNEADGVYDGWLVPPKDLAYVIGPVAVAPRNRTETGEAIDPLPVEIDALIYAQNGSWFIIPGRWFDDDPDEFGQDIAARQYPGYHEPLNIKISVRGAISENMPADLGSVADWTSKWCGPAERSEGFLSYVYDPLLRYPRRETRARIGYLRFPNFPITSDLVIWGERISGPAGS